MRLALTTNFNQGAIDLDRQLETFDLLHPNALTLNPYSPGI